MGILKSLLLWTGVMYVFSTVLGNFQVDLNGKDNNRLQEQIPGYSLQEEKSEVRFSVGIQTEKDDGTIILPAPISLPADVLRIVEPKKGEPGPLEGLFTTELKLLAEEKSLKLDFSLVNVSGKDQTVQSGSGKKYDFSVFDSSGNEIYRWSRDKDFTAAIETRVIKKDGRLSFTDYWDYRDNQGNRADSGNYKITLWWCVNLKSGESLITRDISAYSEFEIP